MPTPKDAPYKVEQRDLRARARTATLVGLGDQHSAQSARRQLRDLQRKGGDFIAGSYGQGLLNVRTRKQRDAIEAKRPRLA